LPARLRVDAGWSGEQHPSARHARLRRRRARRAALPGRGDLPLHVPRADRLRRRPARLYAAVVDVTVSAPRRLMTLYLPLSLASILLLFPFYWMLITSIKTHRELIDLNGLPFSVFQPTLAHPRVPLPGTWILLASAA